jgi:hypothetical protein
LPKNLSPFLEMSMCASPEEFIHFPKIASLVWENPEKEIAVKRSNNEMYLIFHVLNVPKVTNYPIE